MANNKQINSQPNQILRHKYARDDDWIRNFLSRAQVGYVATSSEDQPFITPISFWFDLDANEIFFHTNVVGRLRSNSVQNQKICFAASDTGKVLPSNIALNFGLQYESVVVFGKVHIIDDEDEMKRVLNGLINKYFPDMRPGEQYRPITKEELKRTSVFSITIDHWSGKRNWKEQAEQGLNWPQLDEGWFK